MFLDACQHWPLSLILYFSAAEYRIVTTWDNRTIDHEDKPVVIQLERNDASSFKISVDAPFFNDPPPPGKTGEPYYGLWEFEGTILFVYTAYWFIQYWEYFIKIF